MNSLNSTFFTLINTISIVVVKVLLKKCLTLLLLDVFKEEEKFPSLCSSLLSLGPLLFFFLRTNPFAMQIVSYFVWLLIFTWFIPTLYSFFPKLTFISCFIPVMFTLFGFLRKAPSSSVSSVESTSGRTKKKRFRTSSRLVSYLFLGCVCLFLLNYLPYIAIWVLLLSKGMTLLLLFVFVYLF